eukprot:6604643-Prorocentrum_lima.AAC.1
MRGGGRCVASRVIRCPGAARGPLPCRLDPHVDPIVPFVREAAQHFASGRLLKASCIWPGTGALL